MSKNVEPMRVAEAVVVESEPVAEVSVTTITAEILGTGAVPAAALEPEIPLVIESLNAEAALASSAASPEVFQRVATEALMNAKSQGSAADAMADAEWKIEGGEIRVQTELSKIMLPMVVNPEADKIVRAALREAGAGALKLVLLPGTATTTEKKKPRAAKTGSAQAKAMEHPVVQQAQRLFNAEIRNVIDLRDND